MPVLSSHSTQDSSDRISPSKTRGFGTPIDITAASSSIILFRLASHSSSFEYAILSLAFPSEAITLEIRQEVF